MRGVRKKVQCFDQRPQHHPCHFRFLISPTSHITIIIIACRSYHAIRDLRALAQPGAKAKAWEDIHVVSCLQKKHLRSLFLLQLPTVPFLLLTLPGIVGLPIKFNRCKRWAWGENSSSVRPFVRLSIRMYVDLHLWCVRGGWVCCQLHDAIFSWIHVCMLLIARSHACVFNYTWSRM